MSHKLFKSIYYSLRYILLVLIFFYIKIMGIPSPYTFGFIIIPLVSYIILLWGIMRPLAKEEIRKRDIYYPVSIIITIFNVVFFMMEQFSYTEILIIVLSTLIEFSIMQTRKDKLKDITNKEIKNYFEKKKTSSK